MPERAITAPARTRPICRHDVDGGNNLTNPNSSHSAGISETTAAGQKLRSDFFIEIHRGRTEFPSRPIGLQQFLIGAGVECDLRLGGTQMPAVHSRLFVEE